MAAVSAGRAVADQQYMPQGANPHMPESPFSIARTSLRAELHGRAVATVIRRLRPFRYLHDCSGRFRLERLPGGTYTHWKAPPFHGAQVKRTLRDDCAVKVRSSMLIASNRFQFAGAGDGFLAFTKCSVNHSVAAC
jgi:hypothetical protein